ncbi:MAG TPA: hypothetical protein DEP47_11540 [Chloroflexi bacterium]|nr:hypothetical protein [Chloroflexota bacterium]
MEEAKTAKNQFKQELMRKPNVVAVGAGYKIVGGRQTDIPCVIVFVKQKVAAETLSGDQLVPEKVGEVPTDVVESGEIFAHQSRTGKYRPAPGGVSVSHPRVTAGTLGAVVRDSNSGERLILSNNHVLANSNSASEGDIILQPGSADGGTAANDAIGSLLRYQPIQFETTPGPPGDCGQANAFASLGNFIARTLGSEYRVYAYRVQQVVNLVDAAVARPLNDRDILDEILEIGEVSGVEEATIGMAVRKSGRTTSLTNGSIIALDTMVTVNYGGGRNAIFDQQIVSGPMSQPGDSGSLLVDGDSQRAVGLLFAGSDQTTVYNPIGLVQDLLAVTFAS